MLNCCITIACLLLTALLAIPGQAASPFIHTAPVIIPALKVKNLQGTPLASIRLFRSDAKGTAEAIPFQIDEKDRYADYILPLGRLPNQASSNGIFDQEDELSFMGQDMGPSSTPTKWPGAKPERVVELSFTFGGQTGAVYVGIFSRNPPPEVQRSYVSFNLARSEVNTAKYSYQFNQKNYLVVRQVDINENHTQFPLIDSSTFFLKIDFKFFVSLSVNHTAIKSSLEAYKMGPIRTIVRVNFDYTILNLNLDLGMYTEVSFFANSVVLPAIVENPLNSKKILKDSSLFYYGFSLFENPQNLAIKANLLPVQDGKEPFKKIAASAQTKDGRYWISATHPHFMFFLEMVTSPEMQADQNIPGYYTENIPAKDLVSRPSSAAPLGKSPVNVALALNLAKLREGVHKMSLRLFIENHLDNEILQSYATIDQWQMGERIIAIK